MDRVFITSDWHLGGSLDTLAAGAKVVPGMQICRSTVQIAEFIDWIRSTSSENETETTELVINGDLVDFLSPDGVQDPLPWTQDENIAVERLERIRENSGRDGRNPFDALKDFVCSKGCRLTILLGNHDVELSLPKVRARFLAWLGGAHLVSFIYDGEAYTRGGLIVEHGNRYDAWNSVDYDQLRKIRSLKSRRLVHTPLGGRRVQFNPPAGTLLVIHVVNVFLEKFPFLNLLKPEKESVIPLLLALEPSFLGLLDKILRLAPLKLIATAHSRGGLEAPGQPRNPGNLSADPPQTSLQAILAHYGLSSVYTLEPSLGNLGATGGQSVIEAWMEGQVTRLREALDRPLRFLDLVGSDKSAKLEALRHALSILVGHEAFDLTKEAGPYLDAATRLIGEGGFKVVVFGHTHLPKYIPIAASENTGVYINTGTWADILRVPDVALEASDRGNSVLEAFLGDLESHQIERYAYRSLGYAEIHFDGESVVAAHLRSFTKSDPKAPPFSPYNP